MSNRLSIALIGNGAIAHFVVDQLIDYEAIDVVAVICRPCSVEKSLKFAAGRFDVETSIEALKKIPDLVVDCAGHQGLAIHGAKILRSGADMLSISTGAMADQSLADELESAAREGGAKLKFLSGAIGGIDALLAASVGELHEVTYRGCKPPESWLGSPAEEKFDLKNLSERVVHFSGTAREAALQYPKNANVAATVALAGIGLDDTRVELIADPAVSRNIHEVFVKGSFGEFSIRIEGRSLPDNPKTSALAAMSIVKELKNRTRALSL